MSSFSSALNQADSSSYVTLVVGDSQIALTPQEYASKTVSQLFTDFGDRLGTNISRISSFTINGNQVSETAVIRPGETVRGNITTDSKHHN